MVAVCQSTELLVYGWYKIVNHHVVERVAIGAKALTIISALERCFDVTTLHHDNHGLGLTRGYQIVHDMLHAALLAPASLILTHTVLQVKNGVFLLTLLIFGGRIDHGVAPLMGSVGIIVDAAHLSVDYALLWTVVVALFTLRNLDTTSLTIATEEGLGSRVDEADTIGLHEIVVESRNQRVGDSHEVTLAIGLHGIFLTTDVDNHLAGFRSRYAEIGTTFLVDLGEFIARNGGLSDKGIGRDLNLLRHLDERALRLKT